jgi:ferredoxin-NADP reductase
VLDVPGWPGHRAGHDVDVRLTAEDGYQASRSYSIASAPEHDAVELTIERFEDGEVSPHLVDEVIASDQFEVRGPIGGPFTWSVDEGGPLYLIGGGSGVVPLIATAPHTATRTSPPTCSSPTAAPPPASTPPSRRRSPHERLHIAWTYTRQAPDGWQGWTHRVDDAMLRAAGPPDDAAKAATRVFVCGPTPFVGTVTRLLVDQGYKPRAIRAEDFGTRDEGIVGVNRDCPPHGPRLVAVPDRPEAIGGEIRWLLGQLTVEARSALRRWPLLGEDAPVRWGHRASTVGRSRDRLPCT